MELVTFVKMFRLVVVILSCVYSYGESALALNFTDRIIGGQDADIYEFPYQCSLQKLENHACGCSIINRIFLLTAAHCLIGATQSDINHMQVRCGSGFWSTGGVIKKVDSVILHPAYDTETMANDVAFIKLSSSLVFSNTIKPAKFATSDPSPGSPATITGWGYKKEETRAMVNKLQKAEVTYIPGKMCSSSLYKYLGEIKDGMMCGVGEDKDACQGDSGGPLINSETGDQIGIVSWGYGCARNGYPGIYSSIYYFSDWIKENAKAM